MASDDKNLANLDLDDLRGEIDQIDQALQSLIIRRTKVVQAVGAYKDRMIAAGGKVKVPYRPAREARIMRTLVERHEGAFPKTALIQIWREMIAAGTRLEAPYTVALCRNADGLDCWELARLNFGCLNEIIEFDTPREAFGALEEGRAAVGVFPKPELGEAMPWWTNLTEQSAVRVVSNCRLVVVLSDGASRPKVLFWLPSNWKTVVMTGLCLLSAFRERFRWIRCAKKLRMASTDR